MVQVQAAQSGATAKSPASRGADVPDDREELIG